MLRGNMTLAVIVEAASCPSARYRDGNDILLRQKGRYIVGLVLDLMLVGCKSRRKVLRPN